MFLRIRHSLHTHQFDKPLTLCINLSHITDRITSWKFQVPERNGCCAKSCKFKTQTHWLHESTAKSCYLNNKQRNHANGTHNQTSVRKTTLLFRFRSRNCHFTKLPCPQMWTQDAQNSQLLSLLPRDSKKTPPHWPLKRCLRKMMQPHHKVMQ